MGFLGWSVVILLFVLALLGKETNIYNSVIDAKRRYEEQKAAEKAEDDLRDSTRNQVE